MMTVMYIVSAVMILLAVYGAGYYKAKRKYMKLNQEAAQRWWNDRRDERVEELKDLANDPESWNNRMADEDFMREIYGN